MPKVVTSEGKTLFKVTWCAGKGCCLLWSANQNGARLKFTNWCKGLGVVPKGDVEITEVRAWDKEDFEEGVRWVDRAEG